MGKKKVVLSGLFYPVAIVRYFQSALLRREDVELYVVGPYTGNAIPWAGGMFVNCPLPKPDILLPYVSGQVSIKSIEGRIPFKPDLWLHVDAAYSLYGRPSKDVPYFTVGTDPHCVNYDHARAESDKFFNMQTPYMKDGDIWLPYAYDPRFHKYDENVVKEYDFGIIGADGRQGPLYDPRQQLVDVLRNRGYKVLQEFGKVYDDYCRLMNRCKVGLNWSTRFDTTARVFETMAMGCALLTNNTPDLQKLGFMAGTDFMRFDDLGDAIRLAGELMVEGPVKGHYYWETVSACGRAAVKEHTWDARVEQILACL